MKERPLFSSYLQAGFECSTHRSKAGRRLDLVHSTGHDVLARKDYARLCEFGISTVREGLRWHLIEPEPGKYDFSTVEPILSASKQEGVEVIWDLFHFGWPDYLDIFDEAWLEAFAGLAEAFAVFIKHEAPGRVFIAPVNEISFMAWAGGDAAYINPFKKGRGSELKQQLVRGGVAAARILRSALPDVRLVWPEPVIHIIGDPSRPDDQRQAEQYRTSMFEAWDMVSGRLHPELGGHESFLDIIGVNYYDRNQWWNYGETIRRGDPHYRPFREILREVYDRYRRPMFVAETGTEDADRPDWFAYIWDEVEAARQSGVSLNGVCLYPILNHPGWEDDRHCHNGLWDYPESDGSREIYKPLAAELTKRNKAASATHTSYER